MTVAIRRDIVSVSDIETVCEVRETDSPFVRYKFEPIGAAGEVLHACSTFNRRN
jgi:hypothetical protein